LKSTFHAGLLLLLAAAAFTLAAQSSDEGWEGRPKLTVSIDFLSRTRLEVWGELQHGWNFSFHRWRTGAIVSYRLRPIVNFHQNEIDEEKKHHLVLGAGYEYLHTVQGTGTKIENRLLSEATPRVLLKRVLLADRNRTEFRWVNGVYDFRYRNKLVVSDRLQVRDFRFTPYGSGELYYDRNHHSWNQNQYGFGVQFPSRKA
jgi:hypothetical protein